jgi:hypothetical protein
VPGARCPVPGARGPVPGARGPGPGARCPGRYSVCPERPADDVGCVVVRHGGLVEEGGGEAFDGRPENTWLFNCDEFGT